MQSRVGSERQVGNEEPLAPPACTRAATILAGRALACLQSGRSTYSIHPLTSRSRGRPRKRAGGSWAGAALEPGQRMEHLESPSSKESASPPRPRAGALVAHLLLKPTPSQHPRSSSPQLPHISRLSHLCCLRMRDHTSRCLCVNSTTSPTTQEVSSRLPPRPIGAFGYSPRWLGCVFRWHSETMRIATCFSSAGGVGMNLSSQCRRGSISLQMAMTSSRKRLSKTPSLPITTTSPS
mmetsp:Transcript_57490/g.153577  ORF Transcript_57490/g.153577 Transcript_57490/m.153577 type:complete len:237 (-) Transcript_57490:789-1499(-)